MIWDFTTLEYVREVLRKCKHLINIYDFIYLIGSKILFLKTWTKIMSLN